jgi:BSD domain
MWNFLKADLQELVSVVKEDAASLGIPLAEHDSTAATAEENQENDEQHNLRWSSANNVRAFHPTKTAAQKEAERRMNVPDMFTVPLLPMETTIAPPSHDPSSVSPDDMAVEESSDLINESRDSEYDEMEDDEIKQVQEYQATFNIDEQTDAISNALEQYPDSLRTQFEILVPEHVTYHEFWERYFYRCDAARIEQEWMIEEERSRAARQQLVSNVTSFFGGAAKAVAEGVANALTEDDVGGHAAKNATVSGLGSIFGTHRPPFVMNTAVDEDDAEEEQLGWDDDDEDTDEEQIVYEDFSGKSMKSAPVSRSVDTSLGNDEEQIEFKDEAYDALKEQLKQAIEERDMLHQTVSLQTKEITSLKAAVSDPPAAAIQDSDVIAVIATDENVVDNDATLRTLQAKVQDIASQLAEKESHIIEVTNQFELKTNVMQGQIESLTKENEILRGTLKDKESSTSFEHSALEEKIAMIEGQKSATERDWEATKSDLLASKTEISNLTLELQELKRTKFIEPLPLPSPAIVDGSTMSSSADTMSTGVKIPPVVSKIVVNSDNNEEEEGWGDDWD